MSTSRHPHHYDVLIAGAGPAGTACALALSSSGLRVALLDKASFPRDKICGDAIPSPTLKHLARLDPAYATELQELLAPHRADTAFSRMLAPNGRALRIQWHNPAFNSPRLHFDDALLILVRRHTATKVLEKYTIRQVEADADGVTVWPTDPAQEPLRAALVIGCDGANSVVYRQLAPSARLNRAYHCAAVRAYYQGVADAPENTSDFYFLREFQAGYCWVFPVGNGVYNVGFGALSEEITARRLDLKDVLQDLLAEHPHLAPRFATATQLTPVTGFGLPLGGSARPVHGARWLLCGDAAALIDPLQGHGIDKAVHSGILAAQQAQRSFQAGRFDAECLAEYAREVERHIGRELARRYRIMRFLAGKPWLVNLAVGAATWPWLRRRLVRAVG
ncbi:geranylgeranyl reductase family protein [Hymenobacter sediminicola]|uniref:Geranylgeranyl reductase family protein n=1 Tax=Hymenobacter sediminicola TaxID=2761579 RepID=A0A7G7W9Z5_9BACT|nr:geranylgeranyl reductase family protein [Hymenobacter sediminicola]QNH63188.1 geranylgeranyl reductase family protein [Hymenobacter sediminicola]